MPILHWEISTHYNNTISLNDAQIVEWSQHKLPMLVKDFNDRTLGLITWNKFSSSKKVRRCKSGYLIKVCDFFTLPKMKSRVILRKAVGL